MSTKVLKNKSVKGEVISMKFRIVALYKNTEGFYEDFNMTINETTDEGSLYYKLRRIEDLVTSGYILDSCFITTDEELYFKKMLESSIMVLKSTVNSYKEYLDGLKDKYTKEDDKGVINETRRLQEDYEKTLMRKVGMRCSRCLNRDIEVTDELALQCYDLYTKGEI